MTLEIPENFKSPQERNFKSDLGYTVVFEPPESKSDVISTISALKRTQTLGGGEWWGWWGSGAQ